MGAYVEMLHRAPTPADRQALIAKARFSPQQLPPSGDAAKLGWPGAPLPRPMLTGLAPQAVAPGVVVVPAPGHSPGSQLIFVRLANGQELLFAGDVATMAISWQQLRARSRLLAHYLTDEDRPAVYSWLLTIRELASEAPKMLVVPGHDLDWIEAHTRAGDMAPQFSGGRKD